MTSVKPIQPCTVLKPASRWSDSTEPTCLSLEDQLTHTMYTLQDGLSKRQYDEAKQAVKELNGWIEKLSEEQCKQKSTKSKLDRLIRGVQSGLTSSPVGTLALWNVGSRDQSIGYMMSIRRMMLGDWTGIHSMENTILHYTTQEPSKETRLVWNTNISHCFDILPVFHTVSLQQDLLADSSHLSTSSIETKTPTTSNPDWKVTSKPVLCNPDVYDGLQLVFEDWNWPWIVNAAMELIKIQSRNAEMDFCIQNGRCYRSAQVSILTHFAFVSKAFSVNLSSNTMNTRSYLYAQHLRSMAQTASAEDPLLCALDTSYLADQGFLATTDEECMFEVQVVPEKTTLGNHSSPPILTSWSLRAGSSKQLQHIMALYPNLPPGFYYGSI